MAGFFQSSILVEYFFHVYHNICAVFNNYDNKMKFETGNF